MRRKDEREMVIHEAKKLARSAIRLKHSILAERELNDKLPEIVESIDQAFAEGREFKLEIEEFYQLEG